MEVFNEYFMLFMTLQQAIQVPWFKQQMETSKNYDACAAYMEKNAPMFADYPSFLQACYAEE